MSAINSSPVVIIGAGLAGLSCALRLQEKGVKYLLLEAADQVGGRVRTDREDGFQLDRGFQVLLTAYPQTQRILDYGPLALQDFQAGAIVRSGHRFFTLADPTRTPSQALETLFAPLTTFADKWRILTLRQRVCTPPLEDVLARTETTTLQRLRELRFSDKIICEFFKPFLGGIFLEPDLVTSSRKFEFVFRMFALGSAALPAQGMQVIPQQLASRLQEGAVRLQAKVAGIEQGGVFLESGEKINSEKMVVAVNQGDASQLLGRNAPQKTAAVTCLYYAASRSPVKGPWLVLNGDGSGPINNLCVPSELHRSYAPGGWSLISVTVLHPAYRRRPDLETLVRTQLTEWYGAAVSHWRHLRTYGIEEAVPLQQPPQLTPVERPVKLSDRLFTCGDGFGIASIEGAIVSGLRAAEAVANS